jgi:hypothetical protein
MIKKVLLAALVIGAAATFPAQAQTKKEWVQRLLQTPQFSPDVIARDLVGEPAQRLVNSVGPIVANQVPADKREAVSKQLEAVVKKYLDEAVPLVRAEALKLQPTLSAAVDEKFTEDELKTLVTWLESPVYKKVQQAVPEIRNAFVQKLVPQSAPAVDPKLKEMDTSVRAILGQAIPAPAAPAAAPASTPKAKKPKADAKP